MTTHELKIETPYYNAARNGDKPFEIRYNDRGYQKGDKVILSCYDTQYHCIDTSVPRLEGEITFVTSFNQKENWVVFGVKYAG